MKVFVVNGKPASGKTFFEKAVLMENEMVSNIEIDSMIGLAKELARHANWQGGKEERDRLFLSQLHDLLAEYNDSPYQCVRNRIKYLERENEYLPEDEQKIAVFVDARDPKDIKRLVEEFNAKTIFIEREAAPAVESNHADRDVYNYNYDIVIENNGTTQELAEKARNFYYTYIVGDGE